LEQHKITGISGIDTRKLTAHLRTKGAKNAIIYYGKSATDIDLADLKKHVRSLPAMGGLELARDAGAAEPYDWTETLWARQQGYGKLTDANAPHVVAVDYGCKLNILRNLADRGCRVTVVPADYSAKQIMDLNPQGIFLSNGP